MKKLLFLVFALLIFSVAFRNDIIKETFDEVNWGNDIDLALNLASISNKIIMIEFMAEWCPPCKKMEKETFSNESVIEKLNEFILVKIDIDEQQNIAKAYNGNARKYGGIGVPNILFLDKEKNIVHRIVGFHNANQLITVMDSVLIKL